MFLFYVCKVFTELTKLLKAARKDERVRKVIKFIITYGSIIIFSEYVNYKAADLAIEVIKHLLI